MTHRLAHNMREVAKRTPGQARELLKQAADRIDMSAKITYEDSDGRHSWWTDGKDSRDLDRAVIDQIEKLRDSGKRLIKTEMTIGGVDWLYEYDETGEHVVHLMRNGEDMP